MSKTYETWTLDELKKELRARKMKLSGRKQDLIDRQIDIDREREREI